MQAVYRRSLSPLCCPKIPLPFLLSTMGSPRLFSPGCSTPAWWMPTFWTLRSLWPTSRHSGGWGNRCPISGKNSHSTCRHFTRPRPPSIKSDATSWMTAKGPRKKRRASSPSPFPPGVGRPSPPWHLPSSTPSKTGYKGSSTSFHTPASSSRPLRSFGIFWGMKTCWSTTPTSVFASGRRTR